MIGEWLVIIIVAVLVFKPKDLPVLVDNLAKILKSIDGLRCEFFTFKDSYLARQQLIISTEKAAAADEVYSNSAPSSAQRAPAK